MWAPKVEVKAGIVKYIHLKWRDPAQALTKDATLH